MNKYYHVSFFYLLIIIVFCFCSSCKKEVITPTQPNTNVQLWQLDQHYYLSGKILLNSSVSNDTFTVAGFGSISVVDSLSLIPKKTVPVWSNSISLSNKPVSFGNYWVYAGTNGAQFIFYSPIYFRGNTSGATPFFWNMRLNDLDSSYSKNATAHPSTYTNPIGAFNNLNQFLSVASDSNGVGSFCLIDLNPSYIPAFDSFLAEFTPKLTKIPLQGYDKNISYVALIASYKEKFFVSTDQGTYIAYPNGTYKSLSQFKSYLTDIFTYHDTLYTLTYSQTLYRSTDQGETWSYFASNFPSGQAKSFHIGKETYFYIYSQIFHVDFTTGEIKELDNSGLEYNEITSINQFGDKVWITTLSGMFYTNIDKFLTYKPNMLSKINNRIQSKRIDLFKFSPNQ